VVRASQAHVEGIGRVVREVWDQEILPDACRRLICGLWSTIWVAESEGSVEGFASGFLTVDGSGRRRGEIDLLAVRPDRQGEGLGPRLIAGLAGEAASWKVDVLRALIRVENHPSQKAFERAGFKTDRRVHRLLLWSPCSSLQPPEPPESVSLIPVDTITYRGVWIEGLASVGHPAQRAAVAAARAFAAQENRLNTGALVPAGAAIELAPGLSQQEATVQGDYYWFRRGSD
jgi:GNAT superfamily N-acetyltransferase